MQQEGQAKASSLGKTKLGDQPQAEEAEVDKEASTEGNDFVAEGATKVTPISTAIDYEPDVAIEDNLEKATTPPSSDDFLVEEGADLVTSSEL